MLYRRWEETTNPSLKWQRLIFENICLKGWGNQYQSLFEDVMKTKYPDFVVIKPTGRQGDWKSDGISSSGQIVYQVYAPLISGSKKAVAKMERDFHGAVKKWSPKKWVFVYGEFGFPPTIYNKARQLQNASGIEVETTSNEYLWNIIRKLDEDERNRILGVIETPESKIKELLEDIYSILVEQQNNSRVSTRFTHLNGVLESSYSSPQVIRSDGVKLIDLSSGYPLSRMKESQEVVNSLDLADDDIRFSYASLVGDSASGKTTLMLSIGYKLSQIGWDVYYADAAELINYDQHTVDIFSNAKSDTLLLVDAVNVYPKYAKHIISGFRQLKSKHGQSKKIRLLLASSIKDTTGDSYWTDLEHVLESGPNISIEVDIPLLSELIDKLKIMENVSVPLSPNQIAESYGTDMSLIAEIVSQWRVGELDLENTLSQKAIERRTHELRAVDKKTGQIALLIISIFTKMSCMVSSQFVNKLLRKMNYPRGPEIIQGMIDMGHLIIEKMGSDVLLALSNPSISTLLVQQMGSVLKTELEIGLNRENLNVDEYLIQQYVEEPPPDIERFNLYKYAYFIENRILDEIELDIRYYELFSSGQDSVSGPYNSGVYALPEQMKQRGRQALAAASRTIADSKGKGFVNPPKNEGGMNNE